jgi:hypothetical protein
MKNSFTVGKRIWIKTYGAAIDWLLIGNDITVVVKQALLTKLLGRRRNGYVLEVGMVLEVSIVRVMVRRPEFECNLVVVIDTSAIDTSTIESMVLEDRRLDIDINKNINDIKNINMIDIDDNSGSCVIKFGNGIVSVDGGGGGRSWKRGCFCEGTMKG